MRLLSIDPGNRESGYVLLEGGSPDQFAKLPNEELLRLVWDEINADVLVVEFPVARGMPASNELFQTVFWIGRFVQAWIEREPDAEWHPVDRKDVKLAICEDPRAKDANIRQALIDRYGGESVAIGGVKCPKCKGKGWFGTGRPTCPECAGKRWLHPPGPLYGMRRDVWAALAVGITFLEKRDNERGSN